MLACRKIRTYSPWQIQVYESFGSGVIKKFRIILRGWAQKLLMKICSVLLHRVFLNMRMCTGAFIRSRTICAIHIVWKNPRSITPNISLPKRTWLNCTHCSFNRGMMQQAGSSIPMRWEIFRFSPIGRRFYRCLFIWQRVLKNIFSTHNVDNTNRHH